MKRILFNSMFAFTSVVLFSLVVRAQTVILEQDGASNQFVPSNWDFNGAVFSSASSSVVTIQAGDTGTLTLNNTTPYKNIKVTLILNNTGNRQFQMLLKDNGSGSKSQFSTCMFVVDSNDPDYGKNKGLVDFMNNTAFGVNKISIIPSGSNSMDITYVKVTGVASTTDVNEQNPIPFNVYSSGNDLKVSSEIDGQMIVYNAMGQVVDRYDLVAGENTFANCEKGLVFLSFLNKQGQMINKMKWINL